MPIVSGLIISGPVYVDPQQRDAFVEAHREVVEKGRAHPGCLDFAITADSVDPYRVNVFEFWESQEQLDAWRDVAPRVHAPEILLDEVRQHHVGP